MGNIYDIARPPHLERRKYRRFWLRCPVVVEFSSENANRTVQTVSRNVSIGGLLLESSSALPESQFLSFSLILKGGSIVRPIKLRGEGKIIRVELQRPGAAFAIALQCTHPMTKMEDYLAGSAH
jgi:hypothetical protein